MCRQNVLRTVSKQAPKTAEKLGMKDLQFTKQDRFRRMEEGLEQEIKSAKVLLDGVTNELKQGRLKATPELQKDLALLEKAVADREEGATDRLISPVDPDARAGKKTPKSWTGYKGHMVVEEESEIIAAVETTPGNAEDGASLKPLLKQQEKAFSLMPEELSGDKAYSSGANLEHLEAKGVGGHISLPGAKSTISARGYLRWMTSAMTQNPTA
jgi:IS5 family transposase